MGWMWANRKYGWYLRSNYHVPLASRSFASVASTIILLGTYVIKRQEPYGLPRPIRLILCRM
jgi:hypothetical protein